MLNRSPKKRESSYTTDRFISSRKNSLTKTHLNSEVVNLTADRVRINLSIE